MIAFHHGRRVLLVIPDNEIKTLSVMSRFYLLALSDSYELGMGEVRLTFDYESWLEVFKYTTLPWSDRFAPGLAVDEKGSVI